MLPLESTVRSVSGSSTTSGAGSAHSHSVTIGDHTHSVPAHQHSITVAGPSGSTDHVVWASGGGFGFLQKVSSGSEYFNTDSASGATTSGGGGATAPTSSNESTHTHTVTPTMSALYGVFREAGANTFNISDLEYRVNGTVGWSDLAANTTSLGGNWFRLDLTAALYDATFVPRQSNNLLEFRRKTAGSFATRKSCMIDGQLLVRNIIQSVSLE
jgi:hypothetical protein